MGFQVFNRKSAAKSEDPWVTVQTRGNFSMNEATAQLISRTDRPHGTKIELLFDSETRSIGFRKASENPNPYILRKQGSGRVYIVAGRAFTEHYGIDTTTAKRYLAKELGGGIVGFSLLDQASEVTRQSKAAEGGDTDE